MHRLKCWCLNAGQGLVAFARGVHDQLDYAIKFFLVQESFEAERSLYETKALGALLPQVLLLICDLDANCHACSPRSPGRFQEHTNLG